MIRDFNRAKQRLIKADRELAKIIKSAELTLPKRTKVSPYERLARAIIGQQLSVAAASSIWKKFIKLFKSGRLDFFELDQMPLEKLKSAGVSPQKMGYLKDLAHRVITKLVPHPRRLVKMKDNDIIESLLSIKGVGEWTIHMLLIFHYQRPDVWPVRDLGVKKGFMKVHGKHKLPTEEWLIDYGKKFSPFRSFAALYYWHALDNMPK